MGIDGAAFAYVGQGIAMGEVPYRDMWDHKTPGIYYWNALLALLGLSNQIGIFWADTVLVALTVLVVWLIVRELLEARWAVYATLLNTAVGIYPLWCLSPNMTECLETLLVAGAFLLATLALKSASWRWWLGAGLLGGAAVLAKQTAGVYCLGLLLLAIVGDGALRSRLRHTLALVVGGIALPAIVAAILIAQGAGPDAYDQIVVFNRHYIVNAWPTVFSDLPLLFPRLAVIDAPLVLFVLLSLWNHRRNRDVANSCSRPLALLPWLWLALAVLTAFGGARPYPHYYLSIFLPLAIIAVKGLPLSFKPRQALDAAVVVLFVFTALWQVFCVCIGGDLPGQPIDNDLVVWARGCGPAGEPLYVWGAQSEVYSLTGRRSPSRYFYNYPLINHFGDRIGTGYATPQMWDELKRDLESNPPATIIVTPAEKLPQNNALADFIGERGYKPGPSFEGWRTYVRPDLSCPQEYR